MYAIIAEDGRQYKVREGEKVNIDYRNTPAGASVEFNHVLAVSDDSDIKLGKPYVDGATVAAEVVGVARGKKLVVQKFRRRKDSRRKTGHRQLYTTVVIGKINYPGKSVIAEQEPTDESPTDESPTDANASGEESPDARESENA